MSAGSFSKAFPLLLEVLYHMRLELCENSLGLGKFVDSVLRKAIVAILKPYHDFVPQTERLGPVGRWRELEVKQHFLANSTRSELL